MYLRTEFDLGLVPWLFCNSRGVANIVVECVALLAADGQSLILLCARGCGQLFVCN